MIRAVLIIAAVLSLLVFPWPLTLVLALAASYFFPPTALIMGVLMDALYSPGGLPVATLVGACGSALMYLVRSFVKARIMHA